MKHRSLIKSQDICATEFIVTDFFFNEVLLFGTKLNQNSIKEEVKAVEVKECLLSFGAEYIVFQFPI
jgi:hypothetical protein